MATAVATREELLHRLASESSAVRALGVQRLALFGSFACDEGRAASDVDLLVEFAPGRKTFDNFVALAELLEEALQRRVELVTPEALSPYIGPRILAEAQDVLLGT
jgi:hypothetical protein